MKKISLIILGISLVVGLVYFGNEKLNFLSVDVNSTAKLAAKKTTKSKAITAKQLEGVWKVEEDHLMNKETGKFELLPDPDPTNEFYDQYYLFDGSYVCPSGGINKGGPGKKYSCDGIGWLKYELKVDSLTMRKDLLYPGMKAEKWQLTSVKKDQLEMYIDDGEVQMKRIVKKVTKTKDFVKKDEIKFVPVPMF